jgi:hypothetical protein
MFRCKGEPSTLTVGKPRAIKKRIKKKIKKNAGGTKKKKLAGKDFFLKKNMRVKIFFSKNTRVKIFSISAPYLYRRNQITNRQIRLLG